MSPPSATATASAVTTHSRAARASVVIVVALILLCAFDIRAWSARCARPADLLAFTLLDSIVRGLGTASGPERYAADDGGDSNGEDGVARGRAALAREPAVASSLKVPRRGLPPGPLTASNVAVEREISAATGREQYW